MIQTLLPHRLHPPLRVGVHVGRRRPDLDDLHAIRLQEVIELLDELAVVVPDQVLRLDRLLSEGHRDVPRCYMTHVRSGWAVTPAKQTRRDPRWMKNSTNTSTKPPGVNPFCEKKSAAQSAAGVPPKEVVPGALAALGTRVQAVPLQEVDDRGARDLTDSQLPEFAKNAGAAPGVSRASLRVRSRISSLVLGRPGLRV